MNTYKRKNDYPAIMQKKKVFFVINYSSYEYYKYYIRANILSFYINIKLKNIIFYMDILTFSDLNIEMLCLYNTQIKFPKNHQF